MIAFLKDYLPTILLIIANVLQIFLYYGQLKKFRKELEDTQVIIKDTSDLRNVIKHELEGTWSLIGNFTEFQHNTSEYHSEGFLILTWAPDRNSYDIVYCYSVSKSGETGNIVTAICQGKSEGELSSNETCGTYELRCLFHVRYRTDINKNSNYNKSFNIIFKATYNETLHINRLTSDFNVPGTTGTLTFTKI